MKKIISIIVLFAVMCSGVVFAENSFEVYDISINYNPDMDSIDVCGYVNTEKIKLPMALSLEKENVIIEVAEHVADELKNGNLYFCFENIKLPAVAEDGIYDLYISSKYTPYKHIIYDYKGGDTLYEIMSDMQKYTLEKNFDELLKTISENEKYLGIKYSLYQNLNEAERKIFKTVMLSKSYALKSADEYESTELKKQAVREEISKFISNYEEAIAVIEFGKISDSNALKVWSDKYSKSFELHKDSTLYGYFESLKNSSELIKHINQNKAAENKDEVRKKIYENVMLTLIETKHYSTAKKLFEDYEEYFLIDKSNFNKLSDLKQSQVYSEIAGKFYNTAADAVKDLNKFVKEYLNKSSDNKSEWGSGSGSGGGGGGGGSFSAMNNTVAADNEKTVYDEKNENSGFEDIEEAKWAETAINYLYGKGIVSGYDNKFEPNSNVTRAQFVKMIILAAGIEITEEFEYSYSDVGKDDWYAAFVSAAKSAGIVSGDDQGRFNPESLITRQDMAVIIYRTFKLIISEKTVNFTDFEKISEYANEAVSVLSSNKIINGYEDGSFGPLNNATRAEAAQIVYNILMM